MTEPPGSAEQRAGRGWCLTAQPRTTSSTSTGHVSCPQLSTGRAGEVVRVSAARTHVAGAAVPPVQRAMVGLAGPVYLPLAAGRAPSPGAEITAGAGD